MNRSKRIKNKRPRRKQATAPSPASLRDQYIEQGDQLLASIGTSLETPDQQEQARQSLNDDIDALLKGMALDEVDRANDDLSRGRLNQKQHEQQVNQALDRFNNPGGDATPATIGRSHIYGLTDELIYIGD